jgi:hypothetical protein
MTRLEKIQDLYEKALDQTESFNVAYHADGLPLGVDLFYLVAAIAKGSYVELTESDSGMIYLKETYGKTPGHWVWKYVKEVPSAEKDH